MIDVLVEFIDRLMSSDNLGGCVRIFNPEYKIFESDPNKSPANYCKDLGHDKDSKAMRKEKTAVAVCLYSFRQEGVSARTCNRNWIAKAIPPRVLSLTAVPS